MEIQFWNRRQQMQPKVFRSGAKNIEKKGECCSKDGKRQGEKTYMEKTRTSTEEEDAKKKILQKS